MLAHELFKHARIPELGDVRQYVRTFPTNTTLMGFGAFAAVTIYWYATRPKALKPPGDMAAMQSVESKICPLARRSVLLDSDEPLTYYYSDVTTVYEIFQRGLRISKKDPCLGRRKAGQPYEWYTYQEVCERAQRVGSVLLSKGFRAAPDQYIGIFAQNRPEWVIIELACYTYSMVVVPLYDTLGNEAINCIINQVELSIVFCDNQTKANVLLDCAERGVIPCLRYIVVMDSQDIHLRERGKNCGVEVHCMHALEKMGKTIKQSPKPPQTDDLAVICFTSGTTGKPKGAMITHKNIVSDFSGFLKMTEKAFVPNQTDVLISYLPLAHMFERLVEVIMLGHGARIGYFQGDVKNLMEDLKTLQPTIFPVVPRLLNRMYEKIYSQATNGIKRWILDFAAKRKGNELRNGIIRNNTFWDKLIFKKVQAAIGGKVRLMITGAAPVSPTVLMFLRAAVGCQFYEGYGQTECTAGCTLNMPGDWTAGHVGAPMPCNTIKLIDVEEMNYLSVNGQGEVCVKGPNVFIGYLKAPEQTAEALDAHGWLHTGDIGQWLPNGSMKIIDRQKHIFKLAQGEYIAPEKIETIYVLSEPVSQVFVHGESLQAFLVAIVVPNPETFTAWAKKKNAEGSYAELCKNKNVKKAVLEDLVRLGKVAGLKSFEQVNDIFLHDEMFTVENGLLTPTHKARRTELRKRFQAQIDEMYATKKV